MHSKSRRLFLKQTTLASLLSFFNPLTAYTLLANNIINNAKHENPFSLDKFESIDISTADKICLPKGYIYEVICSWGDKLFKDSLQFEYGNNTSFAQSMQIGENHDGMAFFPLSDNQALLAINHEYNNYEYLFSPENQENYWQPWSLEKVKKAQYSLGVSILEITKNQNNKWQPTLNSKYNKRYHTHSKMQFSGYAQGSKHLANLYDKSANFTLGTMANCSMGKTPWGTYLTCEENFDGYFTTDNKNFCENSMQQRYGIHQHGFGINWHKFDERFDIYANPNEANCFGWIVEIDPYDPNFIPIKHTCLGRFKHENIVFNYQENQPLIAYMGDDEHGEYIYKYISKYNYQAILGKNNRSLLMEGILFVAKFNDNYTGQWIELNYQQIASLYPQDKYIKSQADICIFTRYAADLMHATPMDRPEWLAINNNASINNNWIYASLTNNKYRGIPNMKNKGNIELVIDKANPRTNNKFGQIIRWQDSLENNNFIWDIFLLAGNISQGGSQEKILFNSPDGLAFDRYGGLWIATDGNMTNDKEFLGHGNNQLLCVDTINKTIKRFLVGVKGCEITGICFDEAGETLFLNIQHPGENEQYTLPTKLGQSKNDFIARNPLYISTWPQDNQAKTPRSSTIAIYKI